MPCGGKCQTDTNREMLKYFSSAIKKGRVRNSASFFCEKLPMYD